MLSHFLKVENQYHLLYTEDDFQTKYNENKKCFNILAR